MLLRALTAMLILLSVSAAANAVRVSLPEYLAQSTYRQQVEENLENLYFSAGHQVQFLYVPQSRAFKMLAQSKLDAIGYVPSSELIRAKGAVRVSEALTEMQLFVACELGSECTFDKRSRFATLKGAPAARQICLTKNLDCMAVNSAQAARKALQDDLVDGILLERSRHLVQTCYTQLGMTLRPVADSRIPVYHYMRIEYGSVARSLADKLSALKQTNEILGGWSSCQSEIDWQQPVTL